MVAQHNTEPTPINWDVLDALAVKHLDTTLDLLLGRVSIKSREDFERLAQGDHDEALKYLGNAIALWRLTVRVYVAETRQTRGGAPYLSLDYGFARVSIFAKSVNAIFRNTAHLINDWRTIGYQYGFNPYINVRLNIDRNGYPVVDQLKDAEIMSEAQPVPEIHENLRAFVTRRYASMPEDDRTKMLNEYARTLHFFYDHAEKQDDTSGWIAPPVIPGMMIHGFHQIDYVVLSGFLDTRWQKIDATTNEKQYRITHNGCMMLGRAYPVQADQLGKLLSLDDDDEVEPVNDLDKITVDSWVTLPGSTQPDEIWIVTDVDPDKKTNDPKRTLLSLRNYAGNKMTPAVLITQVKLVAAGDEPATEPVEIETEEAAPAAEVPADDAPASDDDETEAAPVDDDLDDLVEWAKFINGQTPRIEVKTLIQTLNGTTAHADKELAEHLNDCWERIDITVTTVMDSTGDYPAPITTRVVTLQRTTSQPAGGRGGRVSAYVPPRQPRQMVTPVGDTLIIPAPGTAVNVPLNELIETLPFASTLRRDGAAALRDRMNADLLTVGQTAYDKSMQSYPIRSRTAIPARFGASS